MPETKGRIRAEEEPILVLFPIARAFNDFPEGRGEDLVPGLGDETAVEKVVELEGRGDGILNDPDPEGRLYAKT